jgi:hypothetical protein
MNPQHIPTDLFLLYDHHLPVLRGEREYSAFQNLFTYCSKLQAGFLILTLAFIPITTVSGLSSIQRIIIAIQQGIIPDFEYWTVPTAIVIFWLVVAKIYQVWFGKSYQFHKTLKQDGHLKFGTVTCVKGYFAHDKVGNRDFYGTLFFALWDHGVEKLGHQRFGWIKAEKLETFDKTGNFLDSYTIEMHVPCAVLWVDSTTFVVL